MSEPVRGSVEHECLGTFCCVCLNTKVSDAEIGEIRSQYPVCCCVGYLRDGMTIGELARVMLLAPGLAGDKECGECPLRGRRS